MKEIYINMDKAKEDAREIEAFKKELDRMVSEIYAIRGNLAFRAASASLYKERLRELAEQIEDESKATKILSDKLIEIVSAYHRTEQRIIDNAGGMGGDGKEENPSNPAEGDSKDDDLSLEAAIQFLKELNLPTGISEILMKIIDLLIMFYENAKGIDNWLGVATDAGSVLDWSGTIINAASYIMDAMDNGTTLNAVLADIIVDVAMWGIGEGVQCICGAIGTAVGGLIGKIIGEYVGGVIGDGMSVAMEIDWNGAEEGGVGKDALSDWLDEMFDKMWGDKEFEAVV